MRQGGGAPCRDHGFICGPVCKGCGASGSKSITGFFITGCCHVRGASMRDDLIRRLFSAQVARAGGPDVVAALLAARYGVGTKGTVSRMCSGQIGVTVDAVLAVEDDLGAWPITEALAARQAGALAGDAAPCIRDMAARSVLAAGEAHAALIRALADGGDGGEVITPSEAAMIVDQMAALRDLADGICRAARRMAGRGAT